MEKSINSNSQKNAANIYEILENSKTNDVVYLSEGRYFLDKTLLLENKENITVKAAKGEKVYFDGGVVIDNKLIKKCSDKKILDRIIDENARENIYEIDLSGIIEGEIPKYGDKGYYRPINPAQNELFINSQPYKVPCYPKESYFPLKNVIDTGSRPSKEEFDLRGAIIGCNNERMEKWADAENAYFAGFPNSAYADDTIEIEKIDAKNKRIYISSPHYSGFAEGDEARWKIKNLIEELSDTDEYYIDRKNKKLYFYYEGEFENDNLVQLSMLDKPMVALLNCKNIKFEGITFENSRYMGAYIEGGEGNSFEKCVFRNLGTHAIQIGKGGSAFKPGTYFAQTEAFSKEDGPIKPESMQTGDLQSLYYYLPAFNACGGKNHLVSNCEIYNIGAGGIILQGGDRKKLIPANNKIYNTHIYKTNRLELMYRPAVFLGGVGNVISHCELNNLEGTAILLHGNDHLIEYSKIHNVLKQSNDGGAIYMGRDTSEVGNKIKYNFIYDIKNPHSYDTYGYTAIYFDDGAIYNEVFGNFFYDIVQHGRFFFATVHWNGGGQTSVANNIFIDCCPGPDLNSYSNSYERMHNEPLFIKRVQTKDENDFRGVDITSDIWKEKYPYLYDTYTENYDHTIVKYCNFVCNGMYHSFVDENPSHLDFRLRKDFYMRGNFSTNVVDRVRGINREKVKFEVVPFEKIGILDEKGEKAK